MLNDNQCPKCGKTLTGQFVVCACRLNQSNDFNYANIMEKVKHQLEHKQLEDDYETFNKIHEVDPTLAKLWLDLKERIRCLDTYEAKESLEIQVYKIQKEVGIETVDGSHAHTLLPALSLNTFAIQAEIKRQNNLHSLFWTGRYQGDNDDIK